MAELTQNPISFPWQMFMEAQAQKNKNFQDMLGNLSGIGTSLGQIGLNEQKQKAQSTVAQALEAMRTNKLPMQGPQLPGSGLTQGQPLPTSGMGALTPQTKLPEGLEQALMTLDPKFGSNQFDPLVQSEIFKNMKSGEGDIMYGAPAAEAALSGDVGKFSALTGGKPISQKTLNIMSTGRGREGFAERQKAYLDQRIDSATLRYSEDLEKNHMLQKMKEQGLALSQVDDLATLVRSGNTVASSGMGIKMAKAMGEVGVMTENDIRRYVQSKKLTQGAADRLRNWSKGIPSEATLDEIQQINKVIKSSFDTKVQPIYDRYVHRLARNFNMSNEEAASKLDVPYFGGKSPLGANPVDGWSYVGPAR